MIYAGFWLRFWAFVVDSMIISITGSIVIALLFGILSMVLAVVPEAVSETFFAVFTALNVLLIGTFPLIYGALFESSSWQATPGKRLLGIKVTDMDDLKISFWRALGRNILKPVSVAIFYIGFIMIAFTEKKQGLHDLLSDCLVVRGRA